MEGLHIFLVVLLGVVSCSHDWVSGFMLEETVKPGENITLYCDCKLSTGVYIVWYRNCTHENQPSLVLNVKSQINNNHGFMNPIPRFHFVKNNSSDSYDLLIINTTDMDEGLYYCGTEQSKVENKEVIAPKSVYRYGNVTTRIILDSDSSEPHNHETPQSCGVCWTLLFSLCPTSAFLSSLLSSLVVYHLCQKKAKDSQVNQQRPDKRGQTTLNQDEDVCYAALEIRQASQRPKKKMKTQNSDFSTYSAINTSRV